MQGSSMDSFFAHLREYEDSQEVYRLQQNLFYPGSDVEESQLSAVREFDTIFDVQTYLRKIASSDFVRSNWPCASRHAEEIVVKHFRDHYPNINRIKMAAVETEEPHYFLFIEDANYAMMKVVALHELAHWIKFYQPTLHPENPHGAQYRWILARLVGEFIKDEKGKVLSNQLMAREAPIESLDCPRAA